MLRGVGLIDQAACSSTIGGAFPELQMRKYIVDVSESHDDSLQVSLDEMSQQGWKVVSVMWLPSRIFRGETLNAQYTIVFEREDIPNA
jgi:Domain of unknown function (DUF4177)